MSIPRMFLALVFIFCGKWAKSSDFEQRIADLQSLALNVGLSLSKNDDILYGLNNRMQLAGQEIAKEKRAQDPNIGFDARRNKGNHVHIHLNGSETIVFDHVQVNQGGGYDPANGRFTCPTHGIYQFASTIPSDMNKTIDCEMVMDGNQVAHFHANFDGFDQATHVLVLECDVEQQVWVRHLSGIHDSAALTARYSWPSFSGHLVYTL